MMVMMKLMNLNKVPHHHFYQHINNVVVVDADDDIKMLLDVDNVVVSNVNDKRRLMSVGEQLLELYQIESQIQ